VTAALPTLVLLPGLDGTGVLFADFVRAIGPLIECSVVAYPKDLPMGYAELEAMVLQTLPTSKPFVLLGESFAGPLALRIAARAPEGLVGLVLCVTFARNPFPLLRRARPLAAYFPIKSLPRWLRAPLMWGSGDPKRAPSQTERAMEGVSKAVIRRRVTELLAVDARPSLARIQLPTLVLRATRDWVISKRATHEIAQGIANAQLAEVDGPHLLLKTRPQECAEIVANFTKTLAR
jgi:pimeloyl-[acyl-carrier protein] methyl ester esterase